MKLKFGKEYSFNYLSKLDTVTAVIPYYGENEMRNELKIVDVNGFLISDIVQIVINSMNGFVVINFINSLGQAIVTKILKNYESLTVANKSNNIYTIK